VRDNYKGYDKVNIANGKGMDITHVGQSIIHHPVRNSHLRDIIHVPNASKNLLSSHRFTYDNRVFTEYHPFHFLIKDRVTRRILNRGMRWRAISSHVILDIVLLFSEACLYRCQAL
jgi:hypothetical protein